MDAIIPRKTYIISSRMAEFHKAGFFLFPAMASRNSALQPDSKTYSAGK
jgi:hypothetical protein